MAALQQKAAGQHAGAAPGIISTIPGMRPAQQQQAVLNPVSTAQPSPGVVLNGEPVADRRLRPRRPTTGRRRTWWRALLAS